jgi:hypothetical protein
MAAGNGPIQKTRSERRAFHAGHHGDLIDVRSDALVAQSLDIPAGEPVFPIHPADDHQIRREQDVVADGNRIVFVDQALQLFSLDPAQEYVVLPQDGINIVDASHDKAFAVIHEPIVQRTKGT